MSHSPQDVHKKVLGKKGERLVEKYVKKLGMKIVETNYRTPFGEADLIAVDGDEMVLTDGNMTLDIALPQHSVVHGDALSYSIGAASIIAKVYRDGMMDEYAKQYPHYGFEQNKGYGTAAHIQGIKEHGLCPIHRRTFTKKF